MKYNITYSCGHKGTVVLFGKGSDRKRKLYWYQETAACPDCFKAQKEAERQAAKEKAYAEAKANNLPELIGTEKQVAWAITIRQDFINKFGKQNDERGQTVCDYLIANATQASEWIDTRNNFMNIIRKYSKAYNEQNQYGFI